MYHLSSKTVLSSNIALTLRRNSSFLKAFFPMNTIVMLHNNSRRRAQAKVNARKCYCNTIRIGSRSVKGENTTCLTKSTFGYLCPPLIKNSCIFKLVATIHGEFKIRRWNDEMNVSAHGTVGTIAIPNCNRISVTEKVGMYYSTVTFHGIEPLIWWGH